MTTYLDSVKDKFVIATNQQLFDDCYVDNNGNSIVHSFLNQTSALVTIKPECTVSQVLIDPQMTPTFITRQNEQKLYCVDVTNLNRSSDAIEWGVELTKCKDGWPMLTTCYGDVDKSFC